jgi:uncharacterized protein YkwD
MALSSGCDPQPAAKPAAQAPAPPAATRGFTVGEPGAGLLRMEPGRALRPVDDPRDVPPRLQGVIVVDFADHKGGAGYYIAELFDAQPGEQRTAHHTSARALNRLGEDIASASEQAERLAFTAVSIGEQLSQLAEAIVVAPPVKRSRRGRSGRASGGAAGAEAPTPSVLIIESLGGRAEERDGSMPARGPRAALTGGGKVTRPANHARQIEDAVNATNAARSQAQNCGLYGVLPPVKPVARNAQLERAAQDYAELMARHTHFGHTGPDGSTPSTRARAAGYKTGAGENIAAGYRSASAAVAGWIESDGHCQNLMEDQYLAVGIGMADGADGKRYWVQMFGVVR